MYLSFIAVYLTFFTILAYKKNIWALALTIFLLPSYLIRFSVFNIPMTLLEGMILILFFVWLFQVAKKKQWQNISLSKYKWPMFVLIILAGISVYISPDKLAGLGILKAYFVEPIMLFLVAINIVKTKKDLTKILLAIGFSAIVISVIALIQKIDPIGITNEFWANASTRRVTSVFGYPNAVGLFLAPIVVLFSGLFLQRIKQFKKEKAFVIFSSLIVALGFLAVVFAKSEGAFISILLGWFLLGVFLPIKNLRKIVLVFTLISLIVVLIMPITRNYFTEKIVLDDVSGQIRKSMWQETFNMLKDGRILFGAGLAGYQSVVAPYHSEGVFINNGDADFYKRIQIDLPYQQANWQPYEIYLYPHNFVLNFWSEIGLFGLITFLWLIICFAKNIVNVKNDDNKFVYIVLAVVVASILVHGLVDVPYFKNDLSVFFWLLLAISVLLAKKAKILQK